MELRDVKTWNKVFKTEDEEESVLKIVLRKMNKESVGKLHACCPRYPKPKLEGYFVFLAERNSKDIVALKGLRCNIPHK